jgi:DNA-binding MarR family transcriptional regulator
VSTHDPTRRDELLREFRPVGRRLSNATVMFHQAVADRLGMNLTDYKALGILADTGPITAGRLAEITGLTTGAVTGIVDRLERSGHVRRERGAEDRRKVIIQAIRTPEHDQAAGGIFAPLMRAVEEDLAGYSEDQLALVLEFMDRHAATLQRITIEVRNAAGPRSQ